MALSSGGIWDPMSVHPDDEDALCVCGHARCEHNGWELEPPRVGACTRWRCDACDVYTHDTTRDADVMDERHTGDRGEDAL